MGESWRFRPIQPNTYRPPPSFAFNAADPNPPFHRPIKNPQFLDHRSVRDPNPIPLPSPFHPPNDRFAPDEFLDRDGFRKRMRVEDSHLLPPHPRISMDDQWRLDMIREHGRQDSHVQANEVYSHRNFQEFFRMPPERFNPMLVRKNQHMQVNDFDGHQNFQDFLKLESERRDFFGGEDENVRAGAFGSWSGSTWNRTEENYIGRVSDEQRFLDSRPPIAHDRKFNSNEGPSYTLPKQPQYPHPESYHMVPKVVSYEQESYYTPSLRPHLESSIETQYQQRHQFESKTPYFEEARKPCKPHINSMPCGNNDYRMDSGMMGRVHASQTYPSLSPHPPLPPNDYKKNHYPPPLEDKIELENQQRTPFDEIRKPFEPYTNSMPFGTGDYRMDSVGIGRAHTSEMYPPLPLHPPLPPFPPPPEPSPPPHYQENPVVPPMPSPMPATTSALLFPCTLSSQSSLDSHPMVQSNLYKETVRHTSTGFVTEGLSFINQTPSKEFMEERGQKFPPRPSLEDKPTVIDACHLFRQPHRASRPDHIVIILRGLPGSGKSYLAKALRDLEVESGGNAPRIHSMDDYFMIEVEKKIEDTEGSKSSGSSRGKKQITKKVIEYCYEPEMEEAYRSSMLKAFKKTLDEGNFTLIIVDDRNLRVADFAQFWAIAKRSGYEVYVLEAMYKDPTGCAARNVHGFTVEDIQKMAEQWEESPSLYLRLDIQSLFRGDDLDEQSIQEVDMDADDAGGDEVETHKVQQSESMKIIEPKALDHTLDGFVKIGERWNADDNEEDELTGVKDLGSSKWSKDVDEDIDNSDSAGGTSNALSGLIQAYGKSEKSVHWGDQVKQGGFSIGAVKKQSRSSLIIGPGSGYNLSSNPLHGEEDDALQQTEKSSFIESRRKFTEQLRAERESFKAVFDRRRRQRIGGLWDAEDE